ncbi:hypothetical protein PAPYR_11338 [Paratrimastix pyriformis]|uniref:Uncharacterized protein n=1 Tax=Paratrimastix pyriformis TaxID=342808 RepID=A0ABQ8U5Q0_9EUKA|nr:hypothetical protein PAPYR_11338 [Paratrimastix pyriformis]
MSTGFWGFPVRLLSAITASTLSRKVASSCDSGCAFSASVSHVFCLVIVQISRTAAWRAPACPAVPVSGLLPRRLQRLVASAPSPSPLGGAGSAPSDAARRELVGPPLPLPLHPLACFHPFPPEGLNPGGHFPEGRFLHSLHDPAKRRYRFVSDCSCLTSQLALARRSAAWVHLCDHLPGCSSRARLDATKAVHRDDEDRGSRRVRPAVAHYRLQYQVRGRRALSLTHFIRRGRLPTGARLCPRALVPGRAPSGHIVPPVLRPARGRRFVFGLTHPRRQGCPLQPGSLLADWLLPSHIRLTGPP